MEISSLSLLPQVITIGDSAKPLPDQPGVWEWELFVIDKGSLVKSVNFVLHPTFNPPSVRIDKSPFLVKRIGWGTFECGLEVTFLDDTQQKYSHHLTFDGKTHTKEYKVHILPPHEYRESKKVALFPLACYTTKVHADWKEQGGGFELASLHQTGTSEYVEIINWGAWQNGSLEVRKKIGLQVARALAKTGFFLVENHGVSTNLIQRTMTHSKNFFAMKFEEKKRAEVEIQHRPMMKCARGFTPERTERLNPNMGGDLKESFDYGINSDDQTSKNHIGLNLWPKNIKDAKGFKDTSMEYLTTVHNLSKEILHSIALGLSLEEKTFDDYFDIPLVINRYIRYPPQVIPNNNAPMYPMGPGRNNGPMGPGIRFPQPNLTEMGAGSHVDFGGLTLIYQDSPGLEILNDLNEWKLVPCVPGTFVVNTGYILQKLTNDAVRATKHRVINRNNDDRYSFALFLDPNPVKEITPLKDFTDEHHPPRYEKCISGHKGVLFAQKTE